MFTATLAQAAEHKPFAAPQAADPVTATSAGSLAQVTLSLVLVLAAVFAAAWGLRYLRGFTRNRAAALHVVSEVALGAKERAVLIQVGKQQLLIGVTPTQVSTLHVLTENVELEVRPLQNPSPLHGGADARPDFRAILKRSLGL